MNYEDLTVVITTFHSEDKIYKCLDSIDKDLKILVVDNANDLNFKNKIEKKYQNIKFILSGENLGYAKGNNLGLSKVKSKYALILNPDAVVDKETIKNFFNLIKILPNFAILAPDIQNEKKYSSNNLIDPQQYNEVNKVKGFAMFLNLSQFSTIGFFDENFFIYLEETDLCLRLKKNDKKIYTSPGIKFYHEGASSHNHTINFEMELSRNWHWMWSTFYFNKKHYGYFKALAKVSGKFLSSFVKTLFYFFIFDNKKKKIYFQRCSGLINSIFGKKSWYRPKIIKN